jgi:integrase
MYIHQSHSILFYIRQNKKTSDGKVPLYARISIDGLKKERVVKGVKLLPEHWDSENKVVLTEEPKAKAFNKKIAQMATDLQRHIELVQVKHEVATPAVVLEAYDTPIRALKSKEEKQKNLDLSEQTDDMIGEFVKFHKRWAKAHQYGNDIPPVKAERLATAKAALKTKLEALLKKANAIFDDKNWEKTLILTIDEKLLHFMELAFAGNRSPNTLEKMWGRKKRYVDFLQHRYGLIDLPLSKLEFKFMDQLLTYNITQHHLIRNSAMKYAQGLKEAIDRAVANGWMPSNLFSSYMCHYEQPKHDWLTPAEMEDLMETDFEKDKYNVIRDIYVFSSYTGLSYAEIQSLSSDDIINGIDGKKWISKDRQKTGSDETVPLLPIPLLLIDKYKDHPVCQRRRKVFPVPCNVEYNRCLKYIAKFKGIKIVLRTHKARFYFANEVLYNNGVQLKTVARIMGQKSIKSAEIYVQANRTVISEAMQEVEERLFTPDGSLKSKRKASGPAAKVVTMRSV